MNLQTTVLLSMIMEILSIKQPDIIKKLLLEVKDNGKGMPAEWNYNSVSASLGYQLIKSFVQKMKGELLVNSSNGTHIKIIINKYKLIA